MKRLAVLGCVLAFGCQRAENKLTIDRGSGSDGSGSGSSSTVAVKTPAPPRVEQIAPPLDIKNPPIDAIKTASGLIYKKLDGTATGEAPKRNDTVMIVYTGWRQETGETFFSNRGRQPMPLPLANTAAGFTEAMQLMKKGERAMLWLPPSIGYKGAPPPGSKPETLVYEVEIVDIQPAPPVPSDLAGPVGPATKLAGGILAQVVKPGTGKDKPRPWDTVTFNYTAWDKDGRMFDSTEMRKRPATVPVYRQSIAMETMLTAMLPGSRMRFWVTSEQLQASGKPIAGMPEGLLVYELELVTVQKGNQPPPTPPDVAAPPEGANKTAKGVFYRVLRQGKGPKPTAKDTVKVIYTGWTTAGRVFDSSVIKGEPAEFSLQGVIAGWTDGLTVMSVGDKTRFWIPEQLAYAGAPGKPQGMLVFDIELLAITSAPVERDDGDAHGNAHGMQDDGAADPIPAPPDVSAPPAGAKKSPLGVAYKVLKAVPGAPHPRDGAKIRVHYTGWQTTGTMFETSRHGAPVEFSLRGVIKGWADVFPLLGVGEQARMWVPEDLAYPSGGGPSGMLVFDVELVGIE